MTTVDQLGRPVAAEVALALVDRSLLRLFDDQLPPIGPFFYDQTRTGAFATEATNTFRDEPATLPVSEAVVEEAERLAAQARNDASRGDGPRAGQGRSPSVRPGPPRPMQARPSQRAGRGAGRDAGARARRGGRAAMRRLRHGRRRTGRRAADGR